MLFYFIYNFVIYIIFVPNKRTLCEPKLTRLSYRWLVGQWSPTASGQSVTDVTNISFFRKPHTPKPLLPPRNAGFAGHLLRRRRRLPLPLFYLSRSPRYTSQPFSPFLTPTALVLEESCVLYSLSMKTSWGFGGYRRWGRGRLWSFLPPPPREGSRQSGVGSVRRSRRRGSLLREGNREMQRRRAFRLHPRDRPESRRFWFRVLCLMHAGRGRVFNERKWCFFLCSVRLQCRWILTCFRKNSGASTLCPVWFIFVGWRSLDELFVLELWIGFRHSLSLKSIMRSIFFFGRVLPHCRCSGSSILLVFFCHWLLLAKVCKLNWSSNWFVNQIGNGMDQQSYGLTNINLRQLWSFLFTGKRSHLFFLMHDIKLYT